MAEKTLIIRDAGKKIPIITDSDVVEKIQASCHRDRYSHFFILSDKTVWKLWGDRFKTCLPANISVCVIHPGEIHKNIKTVAGIYDELVRSGATRNTVLVAFGGGVIGDLGGFVASTYHRGIPFVQVPTTLLAQVDSSIGGKTGYNLKAGKNLVGSFYHPLAVISDVGLLATLPEREYLSGLAEMIKAGLIRDPELISCLELERQKILSRNNTTLIRAISRSQSVKIDVVQRDEKESGLRAILNFGHTLGHALEKLTNWEILHGYAVAAGMGFASYLSHIVGGMSKADHEMVVSLIESYGLPLRFDKPVQNLIQAFHLDKKRKDECVEWVLLEKPGKAVYGVRVEPKTIERALKGYVKSFCSHQYKYPSPKW